MSFSKPDNPDAPYSAPVPDSDLTVLMIFRHFLLFRKKGYYMPENQLSLWETENNPPSSHETVFAYCPKCLTRLYRLPKSGTFMAICPYCGWNRVKDNSEPLARYEKPPKK